MLNCRYRYRSRCYTSGAYPVFVSCFHPERSGQTAYSADTAEKQQRQSGDDSGAAGTTGGGGQLTYRRAVCQEGGDRGRVAAAADQERAD